MGETLTRIKELKEIIKSDKIRIKELEMINSPACLAEDEGSFLKGLDKFLKGYDSFQSLR